MSSIKNFYLNTGQGDIFCTLFESAVATNECIIGFYPLFEERMWSQRIIFNFAKYMMNKGKSVLLFDYYGYGESDGDSEDFSLNRCCQDMDKIIDFLKDKYAFSKYVLWGTRTGCVPVMKILDAFTEKISSIILWDPVFEIEKHIFKELRSTISTQSYVFKKILATRDVIVDELREKGECVRKGYVLNHVDGYRIGKEFYGEVITFGKEAILKKHNCPKLIVNIIPPAKLENLQALKEMQETKLNDVSELTYEMIAERQFWLNSRDYSQVSDEVYEVSGRWFDKRIQ